MLQKKNLILTMHVFIGLLAIPGYLYAGLAFKILAIPYVVWMVFKRSSNFLPALCVHIVTETMVMNVIYIAIAIVCIIDYGIIKKLKCKWLFNILLLVTPIFLWFWGALYFRYKVPFNDSVIRLSFFLPLFSFFYGLIIARDFRKDIIYALFWILLIFYLIHLLNIIHVKLIFLSIPVWCTIPVLLYFTKSRNILIGVIGIFFFIQYITDVGNSTFTILLSVFVSIVFSVLYFTKNNRFFSKYFALVSFGMIAVLMIWGILSFFKTDILEKNKEGKIDFENSEALVERFEFKLLADRAPYWAAGVHQIAEEIELFPSVEVAKLTGSFANEKDFEVDFGAHNFYIDAIRINGIFSGLIIILIFVSSVFKAVQILKRKNVHPPLIILVTSVIASMILGSLAGRFPIQPAFALMSLCICGVSYAIVQTINPAFNGK